MTTSLHLLPEDAYPFSLVATYDDGHVRVAWAITFLSPQGANPMELASVYIPPLKEWTGHEVDVTMMRPSEFFSVVQELIG